jgi:hypothetical protein
MTMKNRPNDGGMLHRGSRRVEPRIHVSLIHFILYFILLITFYKLSMRQQRKTDQTTAGYLQDYNVKTNEEREGGFIIKLKYFNVLCTL